MTDKRIRIILDSKGAKKNADELNNSVKGIGDSAGRSQLSVNKLAGAIAAVISIQKVSQFADAFTRVQNQLIRTTSSTEELAQVTQTLLGVANKTRAGIEATADLYTSLTVSTKNLGLAQSDIVSVAQTINNLFLESGKSAAETEGAIRQLGQALQSGALRGDEFNSVAEGAPGILRAIQAETGKTAAELRDLAAEGKISAELIVQSLQGYSEEAQKAADKTQITLAQAFTVAGNNFTAFVGRVDAATGITNALARAIVSLSDTLFNAKGIENFLDRIAPAPATLAAMAKETKTLGQQLEDLQPKITRGGQRAKITEDQQAQIDSVKELIAIYGEEGIQTDVLAEKVRILGEQRARLEKGRGSASARKEAIDSLQLEIDKYTEMLRVQREIDATLGNINQKSPAQNATTSTTTTTPSTAGKSSPDDIVLDNGEREIESAKSVTAALQQELALRRQISDIYRSNELGADASFYDQQLAQINIREAEERAIAQMRAAEDTAMREERLAAILENDQLTAEARVALKAEFDAQELIAAQIIEEEKTRIAEEAANARIELDRAEWQARLDNAGALGNALINLGQGQSKKIFKIGQTLALAQAAVALPTAVMESFKNGGGYPWGLIPAGVMLATGLKNIQNIRSAGAGLGGGGGSVPTPSLGSATGTSGQPSIPSTASAQQVEQRRVYELRGVAGNDKITVDQFRELMEQDGAVVVLSDSVNDASRRNVPGVTAR